MVECAEIDKKFPCLFVRQYYKNNDKRHHPNGLYFVAFCTHALPEGNNPG